MKGRSHMKSNPGGISVRRAGLSLWERIITDPDYLEAKRRLQARYGLPLPYDIRSDDKKWLDRMGVQEGPTNKQAKRRRAFVREVHALFKKFEVPDTWYPDFIADIVGLSSDQFKECGGELRAPVKDKL